MSKRALIIGTETATSDNESGASLRLNSIKDLVKEAGFETQVASRTNAQTYLESNWDLIVVVSYSAARFLRASRKKAQNLWFDSTDSWRLSRMSMFRIGDFKSLILLFRDIFWTWTAPKINLITFITLKDASAEKYWWRFRSKPLVFPIYNLDREIELSKEFRLVFVGDGNYLPNIKAVQYLEKCLKYLPENHKIEVFGNGFKSNNGRIFLHGYVPNSELYKSGDIYLAPINQGSGLKLKVAVPLWNGLRVVATHKASNGFANVVNLYKAENYIDFAQKIMTAIGDISVRVSAPKGSIYEMDETELISLCLRNMHNNLEK